MLEIFHHQHGRAARPDEPVAFHVESAGRPGGVGLHAEGADGGEREDDVFVAILSSDHEYDLLLAGSHQVIRNAEGMGGRRTRAGEAHRGAFEAEGRHQIDVERTRNAVDHCHRLTLHHSAGHHGVKVRVGQPHRPAGGAGEPCLRV